MWKSNKRHINYEKLDRFGDELLRAFDATEDEIDSAATSPFLFSRIRARIEAEERKLTDQCNLWPLLLMSAKHAIPALTMLAVIAIATLIFLPSQRQQQIAGRANSAEETPRLISDVFSFSEDEMLASVVDPDAGQNAQTENGGEQR
jgi:hypothetical protein